MEVLINVFMTILKAFQAGGLVAMFFCLVRVGYKCLWSKKTLEDAKGDAVGGLIGLVVLLGADKLASWLQSIIKF